MSQEDEKAVTLSDFQAWHQCADLQKGTNIGRYQILGLLGKGGMGAVYKAYDPELDRSIAIKILTVKPDEGETASRPQARLMREAQALAKLSHPNVVAVHDVGTFEDGVYIAMEYVKGKTLREWIKEEQPALKETLRILLEAGKGLQAAHAEGIIHRDFKPDNVLIGDKGQIKVLDFGLARAAGTSESAVPKEKSKPNQESCEKDPGEKLLSAPLTRVGAMVGTTVYMAPEHFEFKELDEKTDQFSFCVTLFESLYGKRPFPGKTVEELEENITSGWIEIPQEANVPRWIEEIIRKGISISKDDRYSSMLELLNALEDDPEIARVKRRKKHSMAVILISLTLIILGLGYYAFFKSSKVCSGAVVKTAAIWNEEKKAKIKQAFVKTELSYANDSFVRVEKRLGDYLSKWATEYTETCKATRLRDEQPVEIMVLKMGCLDKHLRNAGALAKVFREADKTVVEKAVQAVASLSGFSNCNDIEALESKIPLPKDEKTKNKVEAIRERLARVIALARAGKYQDGSDLAAKALATEITYQPILAEVMYWQGYLMEKTAQYKSAKLILKEAAIIADRNRHDKIRANALVRLLWIVGYRLQNFDEALELNRTVESAVLRLENSEVTADWLNILGLVLFKKGENNLALERLVRAMNMSEKILGKEHPVVASRQSNIGLVLGKVGDFDQAILYHKRALEIMTKTYGPKHPSVAFSLNNLGVVFSDMCEYEQASEYYKRALAIWEKNLDPNHSDLAMVIYNLCEVFWSKGECGQAKRYCSKALAMWEKSLGTNHQYVSWALSGLGWINLCNGDPKSAVLHFERVLVICEHGKCANDETYSFSGTHLGLAKALWQSGQQRKRSIMLARKAREMLKKQYSPNAKKLLTESESFLNKNDKTYKKDVAVQ